MKHKVALTARAARDAEEAYEYIAREAPNTALAWYERLLDEIRTLESFPRRCPLAREATALRRPVRQLLFGNYRILFIIQSNSVNILHIRHAARRDASKDELQ